MVGPPTIPALKRLRQEDSEVEASLDYIQRLPQKKKKKKKITLQLCVIMNW
jgi:hypothetical protein